MVKVRKVDYFVMKAKNRAGEGARLLKALKKHDVGLLAFTAFPHGAGAQMDFIPEDSRAFLSAVRALDWKVSARKIGFVVQGKDKTGALAALLNKLGKAGVNVIALNGVAAGKKRFGAIFWVARADVARVAKLLDAA